MSEVNVANFNDVVTLVVLLQSNQVEASGGLTAELSIDEGVELSKYSQGSADGREEDKMVQKPPKRNKNRRKFLVDLTVGLSPPHLDYSTTMIDDIPFVAKSTRIPWPALGSSAPQNNRVGQMRLEAPPIYARKRQPNAQVWLTPNGATFGTAEVWPH
ncbi:MAG: hypothetical protein MI921_25995 [Cytophagales bacterium]|nr:hypothetical protein [Cytophagales bacterium]